MVEGEAVLVKVLESRLFALNPAASRIWVAADGTRSGAELAKESDVGDAQPFFEEMVEMGLLERADSPSEAADAFPQEIEWPEPRPAAEAPKITASEVIEALAGPCNFGALCSLTST